MADAHEQSGTPQLKIQNLIPSPSAEGYTVFISHAGEDKATIAIPLRDKLVAYGIKTFLDVSMEPGTQNRGAMVSAMEMADVAVIVLSPEFVAKECPMRKLLCFLERRKEAKRQGRCVPIVIPFFYRLSTAELYDEPRHNREDEGTKAMYKKGWFLERNSRGEVEADVETIRRAMRELQDITGVENYVDASNESTLLMSERREILIRKVCDSVLSVTGAPRTKAMEHQKEIDECSEDRFRESFPDASAWNIDVVLDFEKKNCYGKPCTPEGYVREHLLEEPVRGANIISIHGMGGVGKSTIVRAVTQRSDIRERYCDGIHLMTLGMGATKEILFHEVCNMMGNAGARTKIEEIRRRNELGEAIREAIRWFKGKRCAFVIDDAWIHKIGTVWFSRLCDLAGVEGKSSVVISSRLEQIASLAKKDRIVLVHPRAAQGPESRRMLLHHAEAMDGAIVSDDWVEGSIQRILNICDGLPVSLAAAGKGVKTLRISMGEEEMWHRYLWLLERCRDRLIEEDVREYGNLIATFAASITLLDEEEDEVLGDKTKRTFGEMHRRLCVFEKQGHVPAVTLKHLWETRSEMEAEIIGSKFVEVGLAQNVIRLFGGRRVWYLGMHDSMHDFAVRETRRHDETTSSHDVLLNGYCVSNSEISAKEGNLNKWWSDQLQQDGYIHGNVCRHLLEARRGAELVDLLMTPEWTERQLEMNGMLMLKADFSFGMKAIRDGVVDDIGGRPCDLEESLRLISEAVTLSWPYVAKNWKELWFQICGRLVRLGNESQGIREYLSGMYKKAERPWVRPVNSLLGEPGGVNTNIIPLGDYVLCMAVIEDGERVLCGCWDGRIVIVNIIRGEIENEWKAHEEQVLNVAIGKQGRRVVSASLDGTAKVWDFKSLDCLTTFAGHSNVVTCVTVMGDGQRVVTGSRDGTAQVWDIDTGRIVCEPFRSQGSSVECVTSFKDGEHVLTGGGDKKLRLWNAKSGVQVGEPFIGHKDWVKCVAVTPDGHRIVSGSLDETVRVWDMKTHKQIEEALERHTDSMRDVAVSKDGTRILSCSMDKMIRLWDMEGGREVCNPLEGHLDSVTGVSFLTNSHSIVSCSYDGTIRVWDARRKNADKVTDRHEWGVTCMSFTLDGNVVITGSRDSTLRIWDVRSGRQVGDPLQFHSSTVTGVGVTGNGSRIVSASEDGTICLWNLESRELLHRLWGQNHYIFCATITSSPERVVAGCSDGRIRVWDLVAMDGSYFVLEGHSHAVWRVFVSDDDKQLISVDENSEIMVWELETRQRIKNINQANAWMLSRKEVMDVVEEDTAYDDANLSILLGNREIRYKKGEDSEVLGTVESAVRSWALSPDRKTLCVGLDDGRMCLMKLET